MVLQLSLVQILLLTLMPRLITNITASIVPNVVLTESQGNAITIVNVTNDGQGNPVAGASWYRLEFTPDNRILH